MALVLASLTQAHRLELAELRALLILYRDHMEAHGVTPPDDTGSEALARFRHVFEKAGHLDELQHNELLADWQ